MAVWVSILAQLAKYIYLKIRITSFNMAIQKQFSIKLIYMQVQSFTHEWLFHS